MLHVEDLKPCAAPSVAELTYRKWGGGAGGPKVPKLDGQAGFTWRASPGCGVNDDMSIERAGLAGRTKIEKGCNASLNI